MALIPKLCTPTSAAASSAKKQKQDRIVEENNKDRFSFSEAKLKTGASMRTLEPNFLSFKSFPKMIKNNKNIKIVSLCGRFFSMDRDNRWDRKEKA